VEKLGRVTFEPERRPLFLSEETAREIDAEIRRIIDEQHARVTAVLEARQGILREAATLLLARETITGDELKAIMARRGPGERAA
jgi:cell division protease FtsH